MVGPAWASGLFIDQSAAARGQGLTTAGSPPAVCWGQFPRMEITVSLTDTTRGVHDPIFSNDTWHLSSGSGEDQLQGSPGLYIMKAGMVDQLPLVRRQGKPCSWRWIVRIRTSDCNEGKHILSAYEPAAVLCALHVLLNSLNLCDILMK